MSGLLANTNPFLLELLPGFWWTEWIGARTVRERLAMVHEFDAEQCRAALDLEDLQPCARQRLNARLRKSTHPRR